MADIFVSRRVPEGALAPLDGTGHSIHVRAADDPIPRAELLERVRGAEALVAFLSDRVDDELLEAAGDGLRIVANYAVGYDNVDVPACTNRGVAVANTPDVLTEATADHAWALLLATARRVPEGHHLASTGAWTGWQPTQLLGKAVGGATLGVVGMGRIGTATARRATGFGMRILYHGRSRDERAEAELGAEYCARLHDLLAECDFVTLHTPLTDATHHLIDEAALAVVKEGAVLINTARGPVVDEAALVEALRRGRLWGAGLDVFEEEPAVHPGLIGLPNVVLTPHLGSATRDARVAMGRLCAEAVAAVLRGEPVPHLLNPHVLDGA
jgi:glyoxylate reductase